MPGSDEQQHAGDQRQERGNGGSESATAPAAAARAIAAAATSTATPATGNASTHSPAGDHSDCGTRCRAAPSGTSSSVNSGIATRVCERRNQRDAAERGEQQRHESDRNRSLNARELRDRPSRPHAAGDRQQDDRNRAERQPCAGRERREWIDQQYADQRQAERVRDAQLAATPARREVDARA